MIDEEVASSREPQPGNSAISGPWHPDRVIEPRFAWRVAEAVDPTPELLAAGVALGLGGRALGLLAGRGIDTAEELGSFFAAPLDALHDPRLLPDADVFVAR